MAFCDNRKAGSVYRQLRVLTVEEACKEYPDALFVISGAASRMEMHRQLCSLEIPRENIFLYLYTTRVFGIQYFDQDIIRNRSEGGVFIDGGALDLTDTKHFIEKIPDMRRYMPLNRMKKTIVNVVKLKKEICLISPESRW